MMVLLMLFRTRKICIPGAFFFLASMAVSGGSIRAADLLTPPGLRLVKDPSIVIPADYHYPNSSFQLPAYRDSAGKPAQGWATIFVETRRFASNQSAWIFYRNSDLKNSTSWQNKKDPRRFRFWPPKTTIVIETYKGDAFWEKDRDLIEISAMSKIEGEKHALLKSFHQASWTYARFNSDGAPSTTSVEAHACHQCHSIAFHLTGDLIFSRMP